MDKEIKQGPEEILEEKLVKVQQRQEWKRFFIECLVLMSAVYVIFHFIIGIAFVSGHSMEPTLKDGEMVLFYRLDKEYQKNDIVIVKREEDVHYIKRVAVCGGETVSLNETGELVIQGNVQQGTLPTEGGIAFPYEVPESTYFVLGDNRIVSKDSRMFGAVSQDEIEGRVFLHLGMVW